VDDRSDERIPEEQEGGSEGCNEAGKKKVQTLNKT